MAHDRQRREQKRRELVDQVKVPVLGELTVSTVELSQKHFGGKFETVIMGGKSEMKYLRYTTWRRAAAEHGRIVADLGKGRFTLTPVQWRIDLRSRTEGRDVT